MDEQKLIADLMQSVIATDNKLALARANANANKADAEGLLKFTQKQRSEIFDLKEEIKFIVEGNDRELAVKQAEIDEERKARIKAENEALAGYTLILDLLVESFKIPDLKAEIDELKSDLAEAYKELRQQRPTTRGVFNRAVWDKAEEKGEVTDE